MINLRKSHVIGGRVRFNQINQLKFNRSKQSAYVSFRYQKKGRKSHVAELGSNKHIRIGERNSVMVDQNQVKVLTM